MTVHAHAPRTLLQDLDYWSDSRPGEPWLVEPWSGRQRQVSWAEGAEQVRAAAAWLAERLGEPGSRIGLLAPNCAHWVLADYAIMASGNVTVPVFTTMDADTVEYVTDFTSIRGLVLGDANNWQQVRDRLPRDITIVVLPGAPAVEGAVSWEEIVSAGSGRPAPVVDDVNALATIVFTSGTTGRPKGVMHSMASLRRAGGGVGHLTGTRPGYRFLSYLPLAHLGERVVVQTNALVYGGTIYFNERQDTFLQDLRNTRPQWLLGVPRIWEKLQQAVLAQVLSLEDLEQAQQRGELAQAGARVREFLGLDQVAYILTSTAPTPVPLKAWYDTLGITLYDGYGQSEILPISGNTPDNRKVDSIGFASDGVEIRIAEDGEILARGGGTAMGYYREPEKTADTFEADGWVHTGDRGRIDEDGHLYITGRVKEIFKTARGKYVAPAPIEGKFLETPLAEQCCLTGHGLAQTVMVLVLSDAASGKSDAGIAAALISHCTALNAGLPKHERIGALILSRTQWSQENAVLTHTLKIRRDQVEERFAADIAAAGERMREGEPLFALFAERGGSDA
jgi:long-chain acyl-CoA synthetase